MQLLSQEVGRRLLVLGWVPLAGGRVAEGGIGISGGCWWVGVVGERKGGLMDGRGGGSGSDSGDVGWVKHKRPNVLGFEW